MGVVEINVGSFLWYGVGIVPCVFFIEPVRTAIPRNYHKSRIWDLEERGRAGGGGGEANISLTLTSTLLRDKTV